MFTNYMHSENENICARWKQAINYGYLVRYGGLDGAKSWTNYREKIINDNDHVLTEKIYELIKKVNYNFDDQQNERQESSININININIDGYGFVLSNKMNGDICPTAHFIIQHFRIPNMAAGKKISNGKLLQIAYNVGQAHYEFSIGTYSHSLKQFYQDNKLDDIATYVIM
jgi:hypothetical protein